MSSITANARRAFLAHRAGNFAAAAQGWEALYGEALADGLTEQAVGIVRSAYVEFVAGGCPPTWPSLAACCRELAAAATKQEKS